MHRVPSGLPERGRRLRAHSTLPAALVLLAALAASPAAPVWGEAAAVAPSEGPAAAARSPRATIDALHGHLLDVMKRAEQLGYDGRAEVLQPVIPRYFDVEFMARKSLGRHWKQTDPAGRRRYLDTFKRFMVANYAGRFDGWSGQSFETRGEEPARLDTVIVKSRLLDPTDENVALNYRMRQVGGEWKIIDVYLDGTVSELALRRSEFVSIVKRDDLDALLVALDEKIAKLAAGGEG